VTVGLAAERCFVCDMLERELYELPIVNGAVSTVMSGFEILTLKLE
jgi:hypothetical protein